MTTWSLSINSERLCWRGGIKTQAHGSTFVAFLICSQLFISSIQGQNLDLFSSTNSVTHRGLAGSGIALVDARGSGDINPAGLTDIQGRRIYISTSGKYHKYHLVNERREDNLTRIFKWAKFETKPESIYFTSPVKQQMSVSMGIRNSISPFFYNQRRAITWSPLYNQLTRGNLYTPYLSVGYEISTILSIGMTSNWSFGTFRSEVHGENHGNDEDKWANLESRISGWGFKAGLLYRRETYQLGLILEPSTDLEVQYSRGISADSLYVNLFPAVENATWQRPLRLGVGVSLKLSKEITFTTDIEGLRIHAQIPRFNLFEYGGLPVRGDVLRFRSGLLIQKEGHLPLRMGYAYLPQLYTATTKTVFASHSIDVINGKRVLEQRYTIGSSKTFEKSCIDVAIEYSKLTWQGELNTYIQVNDLYTEREFGLVVAWSYKI